MIIVCFHIYMFRFQGKMFNATMQYKKVINFCYSLGTQEGHRQCPDNLFQGHRPQENPIWEKEEESDGQREGHGSEAGVFTCACRQEEEEVHILSQGKYRMYAGKNNKE